MTAQGIEAAQTPQQRTEHTAADTRRAVQTIVVTMEMETIQSSRTRRWLHRDRRLGERGYPTTSAGVRVGAARSIWLDYETSSYVLKENQNHHEQDMERP